MTGHFAYVAISSKGNVTPWKVDLCYHPRRWVSQGCLKLIRDDHFSLVEISRARIRPIFFRVPLGSIRYKRRVLCHVILGGSPAKRCPGGPARLR